MKPIQLISPVDGSVYAERTPLTLDAAKAAAARTKAAQAELASTLVATMQAGVDSSARAVGAALQPVVEATLAGVARETGALQQTVGTAVQQQLEALTAGYGTATTAAAAAWQAALARQQDAHDALVARLEDHAQRQATQFDQRSQTWLDAAAGQLEHTATTLAEGWTQALSAGGDDVLRYLPDQRNIGSKALSNDPVHLKHVVGDQGKG